MSNIYNGIIESYTEKVAEDLNSSGFYYDSQLNDPFLSLSLHANKKTNDGGKTWIDWPEPHLESTGSPGKAGNYGAEPIAKCILTEDLVYSIQNNFTDNNMGNPLESLFETFKPYAPILGELSGELTKGAGEASKANDFGSAIVRTLGNSAKAVAPWMKKAEKYLNKALMIQGTRFTYYNGTSFNFNNLEMKYTVFSDYFGDGQGGWKFHSVEDYIKELAPYAFGKYEPADIETGSKNISKFIHDYVGFQNPPGSFKMDTKCLDNVLEGTLRLNIGGMWAIDNLVLKNMNVVMSKVQAKDPENIGKVLPLYAEITLQLAPASTIIDTGYDRIIGHKGMDNIRNAATNTYIKRLKLLNDLQKDELNKN